MRTLLLLDIETDDLDPSRGHLLEVAAMLWRGVEIASWSRLLAAESNAAEAVNAIPVHALLHEAATDEETVFAYLDELAEHADIIVAHCNADMHEKTFDERFLSAKGWTTGKPWLDSHGIEYPVKTRSKSLVELCIAHGVPVTRAHRALTDCQLIARLFERLVEQGYALDAMIDRAMRPKRTFRALVSYETNQLARGSGFRWAPDRKMWLRRMPAEDVAALPFKTEEIAS